MIGFASFNQSNTNDAQRFRVTGRHRKFRRIRRGWYALLAVATMFAISLGVELFIGNRPLLLRFDGDWYFPAFNHRYYSAKLFGSKVDLETDFRELMDKPAFKWRIGWMLWKNKPGKSDTRGSKKDLDLFSRVRNDVTIMRKQGDPPEKDSSTFSRYHWTFATVPSFPPS